MAHLINKMAYVGATPWHGLGARLTENASFDVWAKEAGLDFHVIRSAVQFETASGMRNHPSREVLFRDDNFIPLGVVSNQYKVVQPADVMAFFKGIADIGSFKMETAGSLMDGQRIWALAKIDDGANIIGNDKVLPYIMMATSFDGSMATIAKLTAIRVVCNNTLTLAQSKKGETKHNAVRVSHNKMWDGEKARLDLGLVKNSWEAYLVTARRMAETKMSGFKADQILADVLGFDEDDAASREKEAYTTIMELFEGAALGSEMTQGRTVWQFVNSVTEYIDHHKGASRLTDNANESRLRNAWFGAGDKIKSAVFAAAAELVA